MTTTVAAAQRYAAPRHQLIIKRRNSAGGGKLDTRGRGLCRNNLEPPCCLIVLLFEKMGEPQDRVFLVLGPTPAVRFASDDLSDLGKTRSSQECTITDAPGRWGRAKVRSVAGERGLLQRERAISVRSLRGPLSYLSYLDPVGTETGTER